MRRRDSLSWLAHDGLRVGGCLFLCTPCGGRVTPFQFQESCPGIAHSMGSSLLPTEFLLVLAARGRVRVTARARLNSKLPVETEPCRSFVARCRHVTMLPASAFGVSED